MSAIARALTRTMTRSLDAVPLAGLALVFVALFIAYLVMRRRRESTNDDDDDYEVDSTTLDSIRKHCAKGGSWSVARKKFDVRQSDVGAKAACDAGKKERRSKKGYKESKQEKREGRMLAGCRADNKPSCSSGQRVCTKGDGDEYQWKCLSRKVRYTGWCVKNGYNAGAITTDWKSKGKSDEEVAKWACNNQYSDVCGGACEVSTTEPPAPRGCPHEYDGKCCDESWQTDSEMSDKICRGNEWEKE